MSEALGNITCSWRRRANAVRDYMVVNGVSSGRIETVSYGEEDPVAMGSVKRVGLKIGV